MNVIIRADTSTQIGTGHVMRCLALAQAWQDAKVQPIFVMATSQPALEERLKLEGMEVVKITATLGSQADAEETAALAHQFGVSWVVVDGYHFQAEYQKIIKDSGLSLLFFDDYGHAKYYWADVVLNQNIYADKALYLNREPDSKLLLGTKYVLLRREFWKWQGWQRQISPVARNFLVTLGGADAENVTLKVIHALQQTNVDNLEAVVVIGASNPHYEQLQKTVEKSQVAIRLARNVTNMPELMAWADIAIAAGGTTSWELAFMGLPSIIIVLADNQRAIAEKLHDLGIAVNLGWHKDVSLAKIAEKIIAVSGVIQPTLNMRTEMSQLAQQLVDGEGSARVLLHLNNQKLRLRLVREVDCKLLWEWINEPTVRAASFSSAPIPWETHVAWFKSKLNSPNCIFYLALNQDDLPIGAIRYDIENHEAVISVNIDHQFRQRGYGSYCINLASQKLFNTVNIIKINAYIKPSNQASIRAFIKAGFQQMGTTSVKGQAAIHFVKQRST